MQTVSSVSPPIAQQSASQAEQNTNKSQDASNSNNTEPNSPSQKAIQNVVEAGNLTQIAMVAKEKANTKQDKDAVVTGKKAEDSPKEVKILKNVTKNSTDANQTIVA